MNLRIPRLRLIARSVTLLTRQDGNAIIETAFVLPILLLLLAGAVDIGRGARAAMIVHSAARVGAAYGTHFPMDTAGMIKAAKTDTSPFITVVPTATYGCECPDGIGASPSCTKEPTCLIGTTAVNSVYYVELDTSATYRPLLPWPGVPAAIPLTAKVRLRASR